MPRFQGSPDGVGTPTVEIVQEDAAPALRVRHEGVSGNALEVVGAGGVTLWSVDRTGTITAASGTHIAPPPSGDTTGVADSAALNAIAAALGSSGGEVSLGAGTYVL